MDKNTLERFECEILEALKSVLPEMAIEAYPLNPASYVLRDKNGAVLVRYNGSRFVPDEIDGIENMYRMLEYQLTVLVHDLRGHQGAYRIIETILEVLTGKLLPGALAGMHPLWDGFVNEFEGLWQYAVVMAVPDTYSEAC